MHFFILSFLQIIDKSSSQKIAQICGNTPPQSHISISNDVLIQFKTGPTPMGLGFNIYYKETQNGKKIFSCIQLENSLYQIKRF